MQVQQLRAAFAGIQPSLSVSGGYAFESSEFSDRLSAVATGWFFGVTGSWAIFDGLQTVGAVQSARATLSQAKITYDDAVRQVELEIQQAYSNLQQDRELYASQSKNVAEADEALRLASARLGVGAGVQLDVLNAQVALTQAQSTRLSALAAYNSDQAEFDRVTATDTIYHDNFDDPMMHRNAATRFIKTTATESTPSNSSGK
ncbi:MAG: TolC family protein [Terriglobia bacterium]